MSHRSSTGKQGPHPHKWLSVDHIQLTLITEEKNNAANASPSPSLLGKT